MAPLPIDCHMGMGGVNAVEGCVENAWAQAGLRVSDFGRAGPPRGISMRR